MDDRMKTRCSAAGFTILEMVVSILIVAVLAGIYFIMIDSYSERRAGEQAAKVLIQAARAEEDYFAKQHRYFDAEISGSKDEVCLATPEGGKTTVRVPANVVLSLKAQGEEKKEFNGYAFFVGSRLLHRYSSKTGKITTSSRGQDNTG
jgi:prepilin-type N-terminal cleavage/methylation domain-containing protein